MATVWLADDAVLSRHVAVKVLRADLAEDAAIRTRFRNEAIAAAKLSHPNIVATYDTGDDDGTAYIVMELVSGPTLRRIIDDVGGLPVRDVARIGAQVAAALDAAHAAGLVHRDVKPANVLVPERGPVKVTDFGIAKAVGTDDLTRTGTVMGTARYLAPEQVNGHGTDARTDVYGLGLLLFEMLCGHPPFGGDTEIATAMARLTTTAPSVRVERPDAPAALDDIVHRCLARKPEARYASAGRVHDALVRMQGAPTRPPGPAPAPPVAPRAAAPRPAPVVRPAPVPAKQRNRSGWVWVLLALVLVLALGAVAVYLATTDNSSGGNGSASVSSGDAPQIVIASASSFDPPPGDGQEDDAHVANVIPPGGSPPWSTERYQNPLQRNKPGVGVRLKLEKDAPITSVTVETDAAGWSGSIYVADGPGSSLSDWGSVRASGDNLGTSHRFDVANVHGSYVLLWLTQLPQTADGGWQLRVREIRVA
jgi:serine/threonine-protein kinase